MEERWKETEKEVLAEAGASFFWGCWKMRERGDFVVISDLGIHLDIQFGNSPLKVWEFKKWKWGGGWKGGKSTHFFGLTPDFGQ